MIQGWNSEVVTWHFSQMNTDNYAVSTLHWLSPHSCLSKVTWLNILLLFTKAHAKLSSDWRKQSLVLFVQIAVTVCTNSFDFSCKLASNLHTDLVWVVCVCVRSQLSLGLWLMSELTVNSSRPLSMFPYLRAFMNWTHKASVRLKLCHLGQISKYFHLRIWLLTIYAILLPLNSERTLTKDSFNDVEKYLQRLTYFRCIQD